MTSFCNLVILHTLLITLSFIILKDENIPVNAVDRWYKPWFYTHVLDLMFNKDDNDNNNKTNRKYVEYIPTKDYFHRHNKCIFWMLRYDFGFANHPLFRFLNA